MISAPPYTHLQKALLLLVISIALLALTGCERPDPEVTIVASVVTAVLPPTPVVTPHHDVGSAPPTPILQQQQPTVTALPSYVGTPTPDPPHIAPPDGDQPFLSHTVSAGETLGYIAQIYGTNLEELLTANDLSETDLLFVGEELIIPNQVLLTSPSFKIIPDNELVYGPATKEFDISAFANEYGGFLVTYREEVEGQSLTGPEVVSLVAHRYSVNPRLLLAILEYRAGWVSRSDVADNGFVLGYGEGESLYEQLGWAANELNWGYYGRAEGGLNTFTLGDGTRLAYAADINDGTAGVQRMLGAHDGATYEAWQADVGLNGLFATYERLFGNPFAYTMEPLWPETLAQPPLQLPWTKGESWHFTGGPHGGWASGAAWAALDFAPPEDELGVCQSDYWVTAMADGIVTRSEFGAVVVDLDGDEFTGTGWVVIYMHLENRDRVVTGTFVQTGDRLGHPSCEGGFSSAKHLHVARTYNGRWVAADGSIPFEMSGWRSQGLGREYDGQLIRGGIVKEACDGCRDEVNTITAD